MELKLIVIRSKDPQALSLFYGLIGVEFEYHKHGTSPMHYSGRLGSAILELYPLAKSQREVDLFLRLGIAVDNFEATILRLKSENVPFESEPSNTEFGFRAIVKDPEGRKVEIYQR
jgi:lactoylglutathione lyase